MQVKDVIEKINFHDSNMIELLHVNNKVNLKIDVYKRQFEILSNSIDEAREGYGSKIVVTHFADDSIQVQDFGRGIPVDWNNNEQCYNWELVFCELYAGGKYKDCLLYTSS